MNEAALKNPGTLKEALTEPSDPWTDLGLTLPIFLGYHLGVVLMDKINAADFVTGELVALSRNNMLGYWGLTLGAGAILVALLFALGRGKRLSWPRFAVVAVEGALYATLMKIIASYVVGSLRLGPEHGTGFFDGLVMSLGAGFYEELVFRVILFGVGAALIGKFLPAYKVVGVLGWAVLTSLAFSLWHYVGGESFRMDSFIFRWVCGLFFVGVYKFRGFAPAVWTHALYDIWVLAL